MLATKLAIHTRDGGRFLRVDGPPVDPARAVNAMRILGHLNAALNDDGYPWSPCRQLIIFNPERQ